MIDLDTLSDDVASSIAQNLGIDLSEEAGAEKLRSILKHSSREEAFDYYLSWHGILGYSTQLLKAINSIDEAIVHEGK